MWLNDKINKLKKLVEEEKAKDTTESFCVHGEENCVRCATNNIQGTPDKDRSWSVLDREDIKKIIYYLPVGLVERMRRLPVKAVLAGGYIRALVSRETVNDIDIFVNSQQEATTLLAGYYSITDQSNAHYELDIPGTGVLQVIWRYSFKEPSDILEQFDYTVSKAAIWFDEGNAKQAADFLSLCHGRFYHDLARKALVYESDREEERLQSIPRLLKYISYGYSIDPSSLGTVMTKTCLSLDLSGGFEDIEKQLQECYKTCNSKKWDKLTEKYVPKRDVSVKSTVSDSYSYGS